MNLQINLPEINLLIDITILFKLALAVTIGIVIGHERKRQEKSGGSRTLSIVILASTLITILSQELVKLGYTFDFVRLMSYAIASIGFIGSGIIVKTRGHVEGLTTAATLFCILPIGFCIGLSFYFLGIMCSIFTYLILESKYRKNRRIK